MYGDAKVDWPDGTHYEGEFKSDRKHGHGELVNPDGTKWEGEWEFGSKVDKHNNRRKSR